MVNYVEPFAGSLAVLLARPHEPKVETVNDVDGMIVNFWRATSANPEAVAMHADWPVHEADLHARHRSLVGCKKVIAARLEADPNYCNAMIAGWWVWGISAWIGSGWCDDEAPRRMPTLSGVAPDRQQIGTGVHGVKMRRQTPDLGGSGSIERGQFVNYGKGINAVGYRRMPMLGAGSGWNGEPQAHSGKGVHSETQRTAIYEVFSALSNRLRYVRVTCGDFERILTPSVTWKHGVTGVVLDPPYEGFESIYGADSVSARVRDYCLANGDRSDLRIALCGYEGEHDELESKGWTVESWKAQGGYANRNADNDNARRERIWFSPACIRKEQAVPQMDLFHG